MISRNHLTALIWIISLVWAIVLLISGVAVSIAWLRNLGAVSSIVFILIAVFNYWIWRLPILRGWLIKHPNIRGTWRTTIKSNWIDPSTRKVIDPIIGYYSIHQTYSKINMRLMTSESNSKLLGSEMISDGDNIRQIVGVYRNEPSCRFGIAVLYIMER